MKDGCHVDIDLRDRVGDMSCTLAEISVDKEEMKLTEHFTNRSDF
jgi:hypothetical protein